MHLILNQKIYKRFYQFDDFQFVMVVEAGLEQAVEETLNELQKGAATDLSKWKFVFGSKAQIASLFESFKTDVELNEKASTSTVFIIDRARKLRGEMTMKKLVPSMDTIRLQLLKSTKK